jgi:hypothetical protein
MHRAAALAVVICLLGVLSVLPATTATPSSVDTYEGMSGAGVVTDPVNGTETVDTTVATDRSISGFTVGAAVIAVIVGGSYWYFRH